MEGFGHLLKMVMSVMLVCDGGKQDRESAGSDEANLDWLHLQKFYYKADYLFISFSSFSYLLVFLLPFPSTAASEHIYSQIAEGKRATLPVHTRLPIDDFAARTCQKRNWMKAALISLSLDSPMYLLQFFL